MDSTVTSAGPVINSCETYNFFELHKNTIVNRNMNTLCLTELDQGNHNLSFLQDEMDCNDDDISLKNILLDISPEENRYNLLMQPKDSEFICKHIVEECLLRVFNQIDRDNDCVSNSNFYLSPEENRFELLTKTKETVAFCKTIIDEYVDKVFINEEKILICKDIFEQCLSQVFINEDMSCQKMDSMPSMTTEEYNIGGAIVNDVSNIFDTKEITNDRLEVNPICDLKSTRKSLSVRTDLIDLSLFKVEESFTISQEIVEEIFENVCHKFQKQEIVDEILQDLINCAIRPKQSAILAYNLVEEMIDSVMANALMPRIISTGTIAYQQLQEVPTSPVIKRNPRRKVRDIIIKEENFDPVEWEVNYVNHSFVEGCEGLKIEEYEDQKPILPLLPVQEPTKIKRICKPKETFQSPSGIKLRRRKPVKRLNSTASRKKRNKLPQNSRRSTARKSTTPLFAPTPKVVWMEPSAQVPSRKSTLLRANPLSTKQKDDVLCSTRKRTAQSEKTPTKKKPSSTQVAIVPVKQKRKRSTTQEAVVSPKQAKKRSSTQELIVTDKRAKKRLSESVPNTRKKAATESATKRKSKSKVLAKVAQTPIPQSQTSTQIKRKRPPPPESPSLSRRLRGSSSSPSPSQKKPTRNVAMKSTASKSNKADMPKKVNVARKSTSTPPSLHSNKLAAAATMGGFGKFEFYDSFDNYREQIHIKDEVNYSTVDCMKKLVRSCEVNLTRMPYIDRLLPTHNVGPNFCELCEPRRMFMSKNALVKHLKEEHGSELISKTTSSVANPAAVRTAIVNPSPVSTNSSIADRMCTGCGIQFHSRNRLHLHMSTCNASVKLQQQQAAMLRHACELCSQRFLLMDDLLHHKTIVHLKTKHSQATIPCYEQQQHHQTRQPTGDIFASQMINNSNNPKKIVMKFSREVFKCHFCAAIFRTPAMLKDHALIHQKIKVERMSPEIEIIEERIQPPLYDVVIADGGQSPRTDDRQATSSVVSGSGAPKINAASRTVARKSTTSRATAVTHPRTVVTLRYSPHLSRKNQ